MVAEGIQNYVDMAAGLTKATRAKATAAAKNLITTAGLQDVAADAGDRVTRLTEEILAASRANRELMGKLVAAEVDKTAARLGFVRAEELDQLRRELADLRMSMAHAAANPQASQADVAPTPDWAGTDPIAPLREPDNPPHIQPITEPSTEPITEPAVDSGAALRAATKKTAAKKAAAKRTVAKKTAATKAAVDNPPSKKTLAKAPASKAAVKRAAKKVATPSSSNSAESEA
jgi:hypothetical protein